MIELGKMNLLKVISENSSGYYLGTSDSTEEVFLPPAMAKTKYQVDSELTVFVYVDGNGKLLATEKTPHAIVGEYALMRAVDTPHFGAFVDWGIEKDLLVPDDEQKVEIRMGEFHVIRVCLDEVTERVFGSTKLGKFIQASQFDMEVGAKVSITPVQKEELGYRAIISKKFLGMIYHNEIFSQVVIGEPLEGVVKKLRNDGLIDAALQVQGVQNLFDSKDKILDMLSKCGGKSDLHDKSKPEEIREALGISKQSFKNALGMLYRDRKILIKKDGIELVED